MFGKVLVYLIVLSHFLVSLFVLFGWMFPEIYWIYLSFLLLLPLIWFVHGSCILWDLEKKLRKAYNPKFKTNRTFIAYYFHILFGNILNQSRIHSIQAATHILLIIGNVSYIIQKYFM